MVRGQMPQGSPGFDPVAVLGTGPVEAVGCRFVLDDSKAVGCSDSIALGVSVNQPLGFLIYEFIVKWEGKARS